MPRFDADRIAVTRFVLALSGIIAVGIISLSIKDYVQQRKAKPESTSPPAVYSNAQNVEKKKTISATAKIRRARLSPTEAHASARAQTASGPGNLIAERSLTSEKSATASAKAIGVNDAPNTVIVRPAHYQVEAAMGDRNNPGRHEFHMITACVPLPNGTKPKDADATYYQNWAREYSCLF